MPGLDIARCVGLFDSFLMEEDHIATETPAPSPPSEAHANKKTGKLGFLSFHLSKDWKCLALSFNKKKRNTMGRDSI